MLDIPDKPKMNDLPNTVGTGKGSGSPFEHILKELSSAPDKALDVAENAGSQFAKVSQVLSSSTAEILPGLSIV